RLQNSHFWTRHQQFVDDNDDSVMNPDPFDAFPNELSLSNSSSPPPPAPPLFSFIPPPPPLPPAPLLLSPNNQTPRLRLRPPTTPGPLFRRFKMNNLLLHPFTALERRRHRNKATREQTAEPKMVHTVDDEATPNAAINHIKESEISTPRTPDMPSVDHITYPTKEIG
ncbi:hypothetical protein SK128_013814, partial [Halocaridina rubra]